MPMSRTSRLALIITGFVLVLAILGTSVIFLTGVYVRHWDSAFTRQVANTFPIPAARVGSRTILLREYYAGISSVQKYLQSSEAATQNQQRPLNDEDRKGTLERFIQEAALYELADARSVTVSDQQEQAILAELNVTATSTADFQRFIGENYGWSLDDFKTHIVRPLVLTRQLTTSYAADHGGDTNALASYLTERVTRPDVIRYVKF